MSKFIYFYIVAGVCLLAMFFAARPAHAADAYPACPLKAGCVLTLPPPQELPTIDQCNLWVQDLPVTPADVYAPPKYISEVRARGLAQKRACYSGRLALIDPADLATGYVRLTNSVVSANKDHSAGFAMETTPLFGAWVWGVQVKVVGGERVVDANESPSRYAVTMGILLNNYPAVYHRHGLGAAFDEKRLTGTYGVLNMNLTDRTRKSPDTNAGVCYFINPSISGCASWLFPAGGLGLGVNLDLTDALPRYTSKMLRGLWPFK